MFETHPIHYFSEYSPLPPLAHQAVLDSMNSLGFSESHIVSNYRYSHSVGNDVTVVAINDMVFAHPRLRFPDQYATCSVYNVKNGLVDDQIVAVLGATSAPFHLIHRGTTFSFYGSKLTESKVDSIHIHGNIEYGQLNKVLSDYASDINPRKIIDVKRGKDRFNHPNFRDINSLQLSLFSTEVTGKILAQYFGNAINLLRNYQLGEDDLSSISIQMLAILILADTGNLGENIRRSSNISLRQVLEASHQLYPTYFDLLLFERFSEYAAKAYSLLRHIEFAGFTPDMLIQLYATAYSEKQRKQLGLYDTPLYLTRRILDNIPIEYLEPHQRKIADMTCGWGSFLISGYERLARLPDMEDILINQFIHGNDRFVYPAQLPGLGLLLSSSRNTWHVDHEDAFQWKWLKNGQANIIVGNPPFGGDRKKIASGKGSREEKAVPFLEHAISNLADGGYLAMLMPQSFVTSEPATSGRKQLLENCDVLEIWELPIGVFEDAQANTVVLFAQKQRKTKRILDLPVRVRAVQNKSDKLFKETGVFTASSLASSQAQWNEKARKSDGSTITHLMDYYLVLPEYTWDKIRSNCDNLSTWVTAFPGATVGQKEEKKRWRDYQSPRAVPWLTGIQGVLIEQYAISYKLATTIVYPNDLKEPLKHKDPKKDKEQILQGDKVILGAVVNPSWGQRAKAAIERKQHFVSDSYWVMIPNKQGVENHITLEVITAVVNWKVSNAWLLEHLKSTKLLSRVVRSIPFPKLNERDCDFLTSTVKQIEIAISQDGVAPQKHLNSIDEFLRKAYNLDEETYNRLTIVAEWNSGGNLHKSLDIEQDSSQSTWNIIGNVREVNGYDGLITIWLNGVRDLQTVKITQNMPGWLLRKGVSFEAKIPRTCVRTGKLDEVIWHQFKPQNYSYLQLDDILYELNKVNQ